MANYQDIKQRTAFFDFEMFFAQALAEQEALLAEVLLLADGDIEKETEAYLSAELALYAGEISPFWTGALATSHMVSDLGDMHYVHINPASRNPITGDAVTEYASDQHALPGRDFYNRAVTELGPELLDNVEDEYITRLEAIF